MRKYSAIEKRLQALGGDDGAIDTTMLPREVLEAIFEYRNAAEEGKPDAEQLRAKAEKLLAQHVSPTKQYPTSPKEGNHYE